MPQDPWPTEKQARGAYVDLRSHRLVELVRRHPSQTMPLINAYQIIRNRIMGWR